MRILIAAPGHSVSTVDVYTGYMNALKAMGHEVSGFDYHLRLAFYDVAIEAWLKRNENFKAGPAEKFLLASEALAIEAIDFVPDVVLVICGLALHRRALILLKSMLIPAVLLLTESPYRDYEQGIMAKKGPYAGVLTNDKISVDYLREATDLPIEYLPHSYDSTRHFPVEVGAEYQSDVYFYGTWWPERGKLMESLRTHNNGYQFKISGPVPRVAGRDIVGVEEVMTPRLLDNAELVRNYCGTKIALNHHRTIVGKDSAGEELHIDEAYSLGPRAYEIAACGAFQLCDDRRPELRDVFGDSVATYADGQELLAKVEYYLRHEDERKAMAATSLHKVQACSFEKRAETVLVPFIEEILKRGD